VPDLTSELQQMADQAARAARPPAVADIITRGNRRRARSTAQKSLAALSAVGITAAVILTGAASSSPPSAAAAGTLVGGNTLTETTSSAAGTMTITVKYRYEPAKVQLVSVACSGHAATAVRRLSLVVMIGQSSLPPPTATSSGHSPSSYVFFVRLIRGSGGKFTGSMPAHDISIIRRGDLADGDVLSVMLVHTFQSAATSQVSISFRPIMQDALILTGHPH
jgi:hypothetical protein